MEKIRRRKESRSQRVSKLGSSAVKRWLVYWEDAFFRDGRGRWRGEESLDYLATVTGKNFAVERARKES